MLGRPKERPSVEEGAAKIERPGPPVAQKRLGEHRRSIRRQDEAEPLKKRPEAHGPVSRAGSPREAGDARWLDVVEEVGGEIGNRVSRAARLGLREREGRRSSSSARTGADLSARGKTVDAIYTLYILIGVMD